MVADTKYIVVFCTAPDMDIADRIGRELVKDEMAACVNIIKGVSSIYKWKGEICRESEVLLIIKTVESLYFALEAKIKSLHPYEVPEIISLPISAGLVDYLKWISSEVTAWES